MINLKKRYVVLAIGLQPVAIALLLLLWPVYVPFAIWWLCRRVKARKVKVVYRKKRSGFMMRERERGVNSEYV